MADGYTLQTLRRQGSDLYNQGRYQDAIQRFNRALKVSGNDPLLWTNQGYAFWGLQRFKEAIASFDQALALDSNFFLAWQGKGLVYAKLGQYEEALQNFGQALDKNPKNVQLWYNKGTALNQLERYREAIACFKKAIALSPKNYQAWYNQAIAQGSLGRRQDALKALKQVLKLQPNYVPALNYQGTILLELKNYGQAIESFDHGIDLNSHNASAWYGKARCYIFLNDIESVLQCLYRTFVISPYLYRVMAQAAPEFEALHDHPKFKKLVIQHE